LLNIKNEYIQISISRITVEEDKFPRKQRLFEEEEEENRYEKMVQEFKEAKRPKKRKLGENPTGWKPVRKRAKLEKADDNKVPAGW
jgi:hypothetical protein